MEKTYEVPCPPFNLTLSVWDKWFIPVMYSKRILCFPLPGNDAKENERITQMLLAALKSTVEEIPFLAGSIERLSKEKPWLQEIRSQGAAHLEVKDYSQDISFSKLREAQFPSALLDSQKLCPFPKGGYNEDQDYPANVCRLRANFVDGGLLLVVQIVHTACDGCAISDVLAIFAEKLREAGKGNLIPHAAHDQDMTKPAYTLDRSSILAGNGQPGAIENHPWLTFATLKKSSAGHDNAKNLCTNFHISKESLAALKQAASPSTDAPNRSFISTHDAVSALIWRSIMLARHRAGLISLERTTNCSAPVDCRARLNLPQPYFGNALYGIQSSLPVSKLAPPSYDPNAPQISGLQLAARMIREKVEGVTADKYRDLLDLITRTRMEQYPRMVGLDDLTVGTIVLTSYYGFPMHELDFGEALGGKMAAFRLPSQGLLPGMPVVLPKLPDGSCEFVIGEPKEVMEFLAEDRLFQRFVSKQFGADATLG